MAKGRWGVFIWLGVSDYSISSYDLFRISFTVLYVSVTTSW